MKILISLKKYTVIIKHYLINYQLCNKHKKSFKIMLIKGQERNH